MTVTYVEPMTPIRDWLRTLAIADAVYAVGHGGLPADAFVGDDDAADLVGTVIGITRVGGGIDFPFDRPLVQFDCWAPKAGAPVVVDRLAATLCAHLDAVSYGDPIPIGDDLLLLGADVVSNLPLAGSHPRHVVTADATTQAR